MQVSKPTRRDVVALLASSTAATLLDAQDAAPVVLAGAQTRLEVRVRNGRIEERYLARAGDRWVEIATSAGETAGAGTVRDASGAVLAGEVRGAALEGAALVERIAVGPHMIERAISIEESGPWMRVSTRLVPAGRAELHSIVDSFRFAHRPDWSYAPSVGGFVPDAQYKAPLILTQAQQDAFGIVPDLAALTQQEITRCNHALDLDVPGGPKLSVGFVPARTMFHSVFTENLDRAWAAEGQVANSYYLLLSAAAAPGQAFREAVRLHWEKFGRRELAHAAGEQAGTDAAYRSLALWDDWRPQVWDKESREQWLGLRLDDGSVGGAVATLRWGKPNRSVYLTSWFNSMRTAVRMGLYARRKGDRELLELAAQTVRLAVAAPGRDGAFKCIAVQDGDKVVWAAGDGSGDSVEKGYLGFDMSWTAYWMLRWRAAGLPAGDTVLPRCRQLADFLIARQQPDGMLPTRFDESGSVEMPLSRMLMAETAPVVLFLLELDAADRNSAYRDAAMRGLAFLEHEVIPERKWFDYETFFSCSPRTVYLDERTRQWPANNLALIHAVQAFVAAWRTTGERSFLEKGEALLDYLLLYQQSWTNPVLRGLTGEAMLLGGFTTQNSDAEWSDARQSLAANVILDYYRATGKIEYLERGVSALRAQFPISPSENWAHGGYGRKAGVSSFHWGTGSGMAGVELEEDFLRDGIVDFPASSGVGVNGIDFGAVSVRGDEVRLAMTSPFPWKRNPVVVFRGTPDGRRFRAYVAGTSVGTFGSEELKRGIAIPLAK